MDGLMALIFLGCVFYSGKMILDYVSLESVIGPRVAFLLSEADRAEEEAEREQVYAASLSDRVGSLRKSVNTLREKTRTLRI